MTNGTPASASNHGSHGAARQGRFSTRTTSRAQNPIAARLESGDVRNQDDEPEPRAHEALERAADVVGLAHERDRGADGSHEERRCAFNPWRGRGTACDGIEREGLCNDKRAQRDRRTGGAPQGVPVVSEYEDDAAADEQCAERGEQGLTPARTAGVRIERTVVAAEGVCRLGAQHSPLNQSRQLGVKPSHSPAHPDIMAGRAGFITVVWVSPVASIVRELEQAVSERSGWAPESLRNVDRERELNGATAASIVTRRGGVHAERPRPNPGLDVRAILAVLQKSTAPAGFDVNGTEVHRAPRHAMERRAIRLKLPLVPREARSDFRIRLEINERRLVVLVEDEVDETLDELARSERSVMGSSLLSVSADAAARARSIKGCARMLATAPGAAETSCADAPRMRP